MCFPFSHFYLSHARSFLWFFVFCFVLFCLFVLFVLQTCSQSWHSNTHPRPVSVMWRGRSAASTPVWTAQHSSREAVIAPLLDRRGTARLLFRPQCCTLIVMTQYLRGGAQNKRFCCYLMSKYFWNKQLPAVSTMLQFSSSFLLFWNSILNFNKRTVMWRKWPKSPGDGAVLIVHGA